MKRSLRIFFIIAVVLTVSIFSYANNEIIDDCNLNNNFSATNLLIDENFSYYELDSSEWDYYILKEISNENEKIFKELNQSIFNSNDELNEYYFNNIINANVIIDDDFIIIYLTNSGINQIFINDVCDEDESCVHTWIMQGSPYYVNHNNFNATIHCYYRNVYYSVALCAKCHEQFYNYFYATEMKQHPSPIFYIKPDGSQGTKCSSCNYIFS
ncbi:MAG: hypothetical protein FWE70_04330 [Oscillospiraceae bacterium]|nr:hypothetical protein [Oscillospiraceae bacterium]